MVYWILANTVCSLSVFQYCVDPITDVFLQKLWQPWASSLIQTAAILQTGLYCYWSSYCTFIEKTIDTHSCHSSSWTLRALHFSPLMLCKCIYCTPCHRRAMQHCKCKTKHQTSKKVENHWYKFQLELYHMKLGWSACFQSSALSVDSGVIFFGQRSTRHVHGTCMKSLHSCNNVALAKWPYGSGIGFKTWLLDFNQIARWAAFWLWKSVHPYFWFSESVVRASTNLYPDIFIHGQIEWDPELNASV